MYCLSNEAILENQAYTHRFFSQQTKQLPVVFVVITIK